MRMDEKPKPEPDRLLAALLLAGTTAINIHR